MPPPPAAPQMLEKLSWMEGCWQQMGAEAGTVEQWMAPAAGLMLGMGRSVAEGRIRSYEQMRIEIINGRAVFTAKPSGQPEASFYAVELNDRSVTFENLKHDFPTRVIYNHLPDGSIRARIEGDPPKKEGVDFPLKRVPCADGGRK
jgi:hypothetical protein